MGPMARIALLVAVAHTLPAGAEPRVRIVSLADGAMGLASLQREFERANPDHRVRYETGIGSLSANGRTVVAFVQRGEGDVRVARVSGERASELAVGDVVVLRSGERAGFGGGLDALVFEVPGVPESEVPPVVRPDWDANITDTPGGCAEETGAYRRILLTWLDAVGPYRFHGLNAHRVRITDSFSHYHPVEGGFDELYLVQMVQPGAHLWTSEHVSTIERPDTVDAETAARLLVRHDVRVGDLVYLPRGTVHRGVGGILAQVITVPGFRPGAEIGVDHHLAAINARLALTGADALPLHTPAADRPLVK